MKPCFMKDQPSFTRSVLVNGEPLAVVRACTKLDLVEIYNYCNERTGNQGLADFRFGQLFVLARACVSLGGKLGTYQNKLDREGFVDYDGDVTVEMLNGLATEQWEAIQDAVDIVNGSPEVMSDIEKN